MWWFMLQHAQYGSGHVGIRGIKVSVGSGRLESQFIPLLGFIHPQISCTSSARGKLHRIQGTDTPCCSVPAPLQP